MKFVPNAVSRKVARQVLLGRKHSPTILFYGGIAGAVTATVLACRATLKLEQEVLLPAQDKLRDINYLKHEDNAYDPDEAQKDKMVVFIHSAATVTKLYGPSLVLGVVSIAALTGSHRTLSRRNAGLVAAYAALDKGFNEYRERVLADVGEDKEREYRFGNLEKCDVVDEKGTVKKTKCFNPNNVSVYARFFDETSTSWQTTPEYNRYFLQAQQNYANDLLRARGHLFLNEVYDKLGLERSKAGAVVGWVLSEDGDNFVDFGFLTRDSSKVRDFVNGHEGSILLDFNVDGVIYDKI